MIEMNYTIYVAFTDSERLIGDSAKNNLQQIHIIHI